MSISKQTHEWATKASQDFEELLKPLIEKRRDEAHMALSEYSFEEASDASLKAHELQGKYEEFEEAVFALMHQLNNLTAE